MTTAKDMFTEDRQYELEHEQDANYAQYMEQEQGLPLHPQEIQIRAGAILTLSKSNAEQFHREMRDMILSTGYGAFEYLETINFFIKIKDYISGNKTQKIPEDKELIGHIREELLKYPKGKYTTPRGVIFEAAETGTVYDFAKCGDAVLTQLEADHAAIAEKIKARKEFLKTVEPAGMVIVDEGTGETSKIFPPVKTSNSSYKISLPK